jgi:hypothetical protein
MAWLGAGMGCSSYNRVASQVAHAQVECAEAVRRDASEAYWLCTREAAYAYYEMRLGLGRRGPVSTPPTFLAWYGSEQAGHDAAGRPVAWKAYCQALDDTGTVYHQAVIALRQYAAAIEGLSDAHDFDASGLSSAGSGAGSIAATLSGSTSIQSTAQGIGAAASTLASLVVDQMRTGRLKTLIARAAPNTASLIDHLRDYLDALEAERQNVARQRSDILKILDARRDAAGELTLAAEASLGFDLTADVGDRLTSLAKQLAQDKELLGTVAEALAALATASAFSDREKEAKAAAAALERAVSALRDRKPEVR